MLPDCVENPSSEPERQTVLVVEDEVLLRLTIAEELREAGFVVVEAINADEALAILESDMLVHLVLTDILMPGTIDGLGLALAVRTTWPHLRIIVASGETPTWPAPDLADGFFDKPYDPAKVVTRVSELLAAVGP